jgi:hypothetical protein
MIRVEFAPPQTEAWKKWVADAEKGRRNLLAEARKGKVQIDDALYKRQRQVLFDCFHNKCAYCELRFILSQTGDVEHFRPKAGVVGDDGKPVTRRNKKHPGYYWLAYDWHNLLPSCEKCNRPTRGRDGKLTGKGNRFPLLSGEHSWSPEPAEMAGEVPMLINPVDEDPAQHLVLDTATGIMGYLTERGRVCIDLFGLNREGMPEARRERYRSVCALLAEAGHSASLEQLMDTLKILRTYKDGSAELSLAGRLALHERGEFLRLLYETLFQASAPAPARKLPLRRRRASPVLNKHAARRTRRA